MQKTYFSEEDTLASITEKYPELISILVNKGFSQLSDKAKRKSFGSRVTLKQAAQLKGLNLEKLEEIMVNEIETDQNNVDVTLNKKTKEGDLKVEGLLPCPVKVPLLEELEQMTDKVNSSVELNLKSASQGLDWLKESLADGAKPEELADIFVSAGFDLFFEEKLMDGYRRQGIFKDTTGINASNSVFNILISSWRAESQVRGHN
jgi:hypothetical protein